MNEPSPSRSAIGDRVVPRAHDVHRRRHRAAPFVAIVSVVLIVDMIVAMFMVHLPNGFNFVHITGMGPQGPMFGMPGAEVNLLYIAALLALVIGGAGGWSVDALVQERKGPP